MLLEIERSLDWLTGRDSPEKIPLFVPNPPTFRRHADVKASQRRRPRPTSAVIATLPMVTSDVSEEDESEDESVVNDVNACIGEASHILMDTFTKPRKLIEPEGVAANQGFRNPPDPGWSPKRKYHRKDNFLARAIQAVKANKGMARNATDPSSATDTEVDLPDPEALYGAIENTLAAAKSSIQGQVAQLQPLKAPEIPKPTSKVDSLFESIQQTLQAATVEQKSEFTDKNGSPRDPGFFRSQRPWKRRDHPIGPAFLQQHNSTSDGGDTSSGESQHATSLLNRCTHYFQPIRKPLENTRLSERQRRQQQQQQQQATSPGSVATRRLSNVQIPSAFTSNNDNTAPKMTQKPAPVDSTTSRVIPDCEDLPFIGSCSPSSQRVEKARDSRSDYAGQWRRMGGSLSEARLPASAVGEEEHVLESQSSWIPHLSLPFLGGETQATDSNVMKPLMVSQPESNFQIPAQRPGDHALQNHPVFIPAEQQGGRHSRQQARERISLSGLQTEVDANEWRRFREWVNLERQRRSTGQPKDSAYETSAHESDVWCGGGRDRETVESRRRNDSNKRANITNDKRFTTTFDDESSWSQKRGIDGQATGPTSPLCWYGSIQEDTPSEASDVSGGHRSPSGSIPWEELRGKLPRSGSRHDRPSSASPPRLLFGKSREIEIPPISLVDYASSVASGSVKLSVGGGSSTRSFARKRRRKPPRPDSCSPRSGRISTRTRNRPGNSCRNRQSISRLNHCSTARTEGSTGLLVGAVSPVESTPWPMEPGVSSHSSASLRTRSSAQVGVLAERRDGMGPVHFAAIQPSPPNPNVPTFAKPETGPVIPSGVPSFAFSAHLTGVAEPMRQGSDLCSTQRPLPSHQDVCPITFPYSLDSIGQTHQQPTQSVHPVKSHHRSQWTEELSYQASVLNSLGRSELLDCVGRRSLNAESHVTHDDGRRNNDWKRAFVKMQDDIGVLRAKSEEFRDESVESERSRVEPSADFPSRRTESLIQCNRGSDQASGSRVSFHTVSKALERSSKRTGKGNETSLHKSPLPSVLKTINLPLGRPEDTSMLRVFGGRDQCALEHGAVNKVVATSDHDPPALSPIRENSLEANIRVGDQRPKQQTGSQCDAQVFVAQTECPTCKSTTVSLQGDRCNNLPGKNASGPSNRSDCSQIAPSSSVSIMQDVEAINDDRQSDGTRRNGNNESGGAALSYRSHKVDEVESALRKSRSLEDEDNRDDEDQLLARLAGGRPASEPLVRALDKSKEVDHELSRVRKPEPPRPCFEPTTSLSTVANRQLYIQKVKKLRRNASSKAERRFDLDGPVSPVRAPELGFFDRLTMPVSVCFGHHVGATTALEGHDGVYVLSPTSSIDCESLVHPAKASHRTFITGGRKISGGPKHYRRKEERPRLEPVGQSVGNTRTTASRSHPRATFPCGSAIAKSREKLSMAKDLLNERLRSIGPVPLEGSNERPGPSNSTRSKGSTIASVGNEYVLDLSGLQNDRARPFFFKPNINIYSDGKVAVQDVSRLEASSQVPFGQPADQVISLTEMVKDRPDTTRSPSAELVAEGAVGQHVRPVGRESSPTGSRSQTVLSERLAGIEVMDIGTSLSCDSCWPSSPKPKAENLEQEPSECSATLAENPLDDGNHLDTMSGSIASLKRQMDEVDKVISIALRTSENVPSQSRFVVSYDDDDDGIGEEMRRLKESEQLLRRQLELVQKQTDLRRCLNELKRARVAHERPNARSAQWTGSEKSTVQPWQPSIKGPVHSVEQPSTSTCPVEPSAGQSFGISRADSGSAFRPPLQVVKKRVHFADKYAPIDLTAVDGDYRDDLPSNSRHFVITGRERSIDGPVFSDLSDATEQARPVPIDLTELGLENIFDTDRPAYFSSRKVLHVREGIREGLSEPELIVVDEIQELAVSPVASYSHESRSSRARHVPVIEVETVPILFPKKKTVGQGQRDSCLGDDERSTSSVVVRLLM